MYTLTDKERALFDREIPQTVKIHYEDANGDQYLTESDIIQGTFSIDRACVSGNSFEFGTMIASELSLTLDNSDGRWNDTEFAGVKLTPVITVKDPDITKLNDETYGHLTVSIPMGIYTVDESPRHLAHIELKALDRMASFDREASVTSGTTMSLIKQACADCNVPMGDISLADRTLTLPTDYTEKPTWRQILIWIGQIYCKDGYIDRNGKFQMGWYADAGFNLKPEDRFDSDIEEKPAKITGVQIGETVYGDTGYVINVDGNEYINDDNRDSIGKSLAATLKGFTYYPFNSNVIARPEFDPMDVGTYEKADGTKLPVIVTNTNFTLNGSTVIEGHGETPTQAGYATINPLTAREQAIIANTNRATTTKLTSRIQAVMNLSDTAANALGFYKTVDTGADGSEIVYLHDKNSMADSRVVYKASADGFFISTDGGKNYTEGFDKDGNAVMNMLSVIGIKAEWIDIDNLIRRINNDGTETISGARVMVDDGNVSVAISNVQTAAADAQASADEAARSAQSAGNAAASAQATADEAARSAQSAGNAAASAQATADGAQATADEAARSAQSAGNAASNAQTSADGAQTTADEALSTANDVKTREDEYFKFETDGLRISKGDSDISTVYGDNGMEIQQNGQTLAAFRGNSVTNHNLVVSDTMAIGKFAYVAESDGTLNFVWIGE